jgi:two-component system response regulator
MRERKRRKASGAPWVGIYPKVFTLLSVTQKPDKVGFIVNSANQFREMHEILLVEDSEADARLAERTLQMAGVCNPVRHVLNGTDASAYLEGAVVAARTCNKPVPSILLLDLKLPDISGFDILARMEGRPELANMLRIVISMFGDTASVKKAYAAGAHSFLNKPILQDDLDGLIKNFPRHWLLSDAARLRNSAQQVQSSQEFKQFPSDRPNSPI